MRWFVSVGWIAVVLMGAVACAGYETGYFKGRVNEATAEMVAKRYGPPHQIEQREGPKRSGPTLTGGAPLRATSGRPVHPFASPMC